MEQDALMVNLGFVVVNLIILGLNIKFFTEGVKEKLANKREKAKMLTDLLGGMSGRLSPKGTEANKSPMHEPVPVDHGPRLVPRVESKSTVDPMHEGIVKKGGVNKKPTTPRPEGDPKGQGGAVAAAAVATAETQLAEVQKNKSVEKPKPELKLVQKKEPKPKVTQKQKTEVPVTPGPKTEVPVTSGPKTELKVEPGQKTNIDGPANASDEPK